MQENENCACSTLSTFSNIPDMLNLLECKALTKTSNKPILEYSICNELEHLVQGYKCTKGRNAMFFISKDKVLKRKRVTCTIIPCAICSIT